MPQTNSERELKIQMTKAIPHYRTQFDRRPANKKHAPIRKWQN
jgi:hypothetical protein